MTPNKNYLLLDPDPKHQEKTTESGIVYQLAKPSSEPTEEATLRGTVQKIGEGVNDEMINGNQICIGDVVHFFPTAATEIQHEGKPVILVHRKNISHIE